MRCHRYTDPGDVGGVAPSQFRHPGLVQAAEPLEDHKIPEHGFQDGAASGGAMATQHFLDLPNHLGGIKTRAPVGLQPIGDFPNRLEFAARSPFKASSFSGSIRGTMISGEALSLATHPLQKTKETR